MTDNESLFLPIHWENWLVDGLNCSCSIYPSISNVFSIKICNAPLVGSWLLAVVIGFGASTHLYRLGPAVRGSLVYSIVYLMYAAMITTGLVVHCLYLVECGESQPSPGYLDMARIDASLTSSIALNFAICGLVDLHVLADREVTTLALMGVIDMVIFYCYFILNQSHLLTFNLYLLSTVIGCGSYFFLQLVRVLHSRLWTTLQYLLLGGIIGGASLLLITRYTCWLCCHLGPWSLEGVWYYGSDAAMFFVFLFVWYSREKSVSPTPAHLVKTIKMTNL